MPSFVLASPDEEQDLSVDYSADLESGSPADTLSTSSWSVSPDYGSPGPTLSGGSFGNGLAVTKLSGLQHGCTYRVKNTVTTAMGLTLTRTIIVRCHENR